MIGYLRGFETLICGIPAVIWGAGAAEGTVRTVMEATKSVFSCSDDRADLSNEYQITKGCLLLTGISLLPFACRWIPYARYILRIPSYYATVEAYSVIFDQAMKYREYTACLKRAEQRAIASETNRLANWITQVKDPKELEESFQLVKQQIKEGMPITEADLDAHAKKLHGSLIYRNWSYTITYLGVVKGWRAVGCVARLGYQLFNGGLFTFCLRKTWEEIRYTAQIPRLPGGHG